MNHDAEREEGYKAYVFGSLGWLLTLPLAAFLLLLPLNQKDPPLHLRFSYCNIFWSWFELYVLIGLLSYLLFELWFVIIFFLTPICRNLLWNSSHHEKVKTRKRNACYESHSISLSSFFHGEMRFIASFRRSELS